MVKSSAYPSLERHPGGPDNWVEQTKGLPKYIERIAKHLHYEQGYTISHAIATAVNTVKRWARKGGVVKYGDPNNKHVTTITAAKAAKAVAEWEAKKALARALPGTPRGGRMVRRQSVKLAEEMLKIQALADRANAIADPDRRAKARVQVIELAVFDTAQRKRLASSGSAMDDGSFPIRNEQDLRNAIRAVGRAKNPDAAKRHICQRAKALGLMDVLPEEWRSMYMATPVKPSRRRGTTKDGRPSFKGQGRWKHGFIPADEPAVTSKAKGSPIAARRIHRLYGGVGGGSPAPKRATLVGDGGGKVSAKNITQVRGAAITDRTGQAPGLHRRNTAQDDTSSPVTAKPFSQRAWTAIPESAKTVRNGKRYVKVTFNGQTKLAPWHGPAGPPVKAGNTTRIAAISQNDAEQMTSGGLEKTLKTKGKASQAARANLNAALRKKRKKAKIS